MKFENRDTLSFGHIWWSTTQTYMRYVGWTHYVDLLFVMYCTHTAFTRRPISVVVIETSSLLNYFVHSDNF